MNRPLFRTLIIYLATCLLFLTTSAAVAQQTAATPVPLEQQIRSAGNHYLQSLRSGNAEAVSACWTDKGVFVDARGESFSVRELVTEEFVPTAADPALPASAMEDAIESSVLRPITDTVVVERCTLDGTEFLAVWKKSGARWLLDYVQEFAAARATSPPALESLSWMLGQWNAEHDGVSAHLTVQWSADRKYLLQRFTVKLPDQSDLVGEQRLGWDSAKEQVRSWLFRSDGGFVEGVWQQEGEVWVSKQVGTMPDGAKTSAINLWLRESADRCLFKAQQSSIGGEPIDDVVLEFTRLTSP